MATIGDEQATSIGSTVAQIAADAGLAVEAKGDDDLGRAIVSVITPGSANLDGSIGSDEAERIGARAREFLEGLDDLPEDVRTKLGDKDDETFGREIASVITAGGAN